MPELNQLASKHIHAPHQAGESVLKEAGITLDHDYPSPVVDHRAARERALQHYEEIKSKT